jgi:hypothetical protein
MESHFQLDMPIYDFLKLHKYIMNTLTTQLD